MKFNFLLPRILQNERCQGERFHSWVLTGLVKALPGDHRAVDFYCKICGKRHTEIFTTEEYDKKIKISIERVEKENLQTLSKPHVKKILVGDQACYRYQ